MWPKHYADYEVDQPLIKNQIEPSRGITGCEMHELNGWGNDIHVYRKKKKGLIAKVLAYFFGTEKDI